MSLKGWPVKTIVRGQLVAEDFEVVGKLGYGKFVQRSVS
jgi:dihydropyrimidinase